MNKAKIRLVIVDDDAGLLSTVRGVLEEQPDLLVTGAYASASDAMRGTDWMQVDVLLTDLSMPEMSGVDLIGAATQMNPSLRALAFTIHGNRASLFAALRAGACGYIVKGTSAVELCEAIRQAARGESPISPAMARYMVQEFRSLSPKDPDGDLSIREREILQAIANGLIYKEVAARLSISLHTVHAHVRNIHGKLHAMNRAEAIRTARSRGWIR
jgi:two-component system NarL family response regulator